MPLNPPPLKDRPELLADWIEIRTLADEKGEFPFARIGRFWDKNRETEHSDSEGRESEEADTDNDGVSGGDVEKFLSAITDEIGERYNHLGDCYPFCFSADGNKFLLKTELSPGAIAYAFCLLFEHNSSGEIWSGKWLPQIDNSVRDLFQVCSTIAAAAHVDGCAISFGWPRPNSNPPFLQKLKEVYALFGEGKPREAPLTGAAPMVKDEEIDVIAWKPRPDKTPGTTYLLGQVASGANWTQKSIAGGSINYFHSTWFEIIPPSTPNPAIFIPHAVPPIGEGKRRDRVALLTAKFGMIFDRMIMPTLTQKGLELANKNIPGVTIERVDEYRKIPVWVNAQISGMRLAGGVPL